MKIKSTKSFIQIYAVDQCIKEEIIKNTRIKAEDTFLEIGDNTGEISELILSHTKNLIIVETDSKLTSYLDYRFDGSINIIHGNIRSFNWSELSTSGPIRVFGILPYCISTDIILLTVKYRHILKDAHYTLQKEFVNRIMASPSTKEYARISILMQYYFDIIKLMDIDGTSFNPIAESDFSFISLKPKAADEDIGLILQTITQQAFSKRRKILKNSLANIYTEYELSSLGFDPNSRAENLSLADYVELAKEHIRSTMLSKSSPI